MEGRYIGPRAARDPGHPWLLSSGYISSLASLASTVVSVIVGGLGLLQKESAGRSALHRLWMREYHGYQGATAKKLSTPCPFAWPDAESPVNVYRGMPL